jgi:hypothetical protein
MRLGTKTFLAVLGVVICVAVIVGFRLERNVLNTDLAKFLSAQLPASVVIQHVSSSKLQRDPEICWHISHLPGDLGVMLTNGFRRSDAADTDFVQKSLKDVFRGDFVAEPSDVVYSRDTQDFDVFVLAKQDRTNSFVMVLVK